MRTWGVLAAVWLLLGGLYLAFAGSIDTSEIISAVVAGTLAAGLGTAIATIDERRFELVLPAKAVLRPLASLLPDFLALARLLLSFGIVERQLGALVQQPFHSGGTDGASTTRRAVTILGLSLAPRAFVVRRSRRRASSALPPGENAVARPRMAVVTIWLAGVLLLLPALAVPIFVAVRGSANNRLVSIQLASALTTVILALMSFAFDQSSSIDLALSLALLSIPGSYLYAMFMERWL